VIQAKALLRCAYRRDGAPHVRHTMRYQRLQLWKIAVDTQSAMIKSLQHITIEPPSVEPFPDVNGPDMWFGIFLLDIL